MAAIEWWPLLKAAAALQQVVREAVEHLNASASPADRRSHRILHRAFVHPASTLERAADALGLPSSTFRRRLAAATDRLTDLPVGPGDR